MAVQLTRRAAIAGAAGVAATALTGCRASPAPRPPVDPDADALRQAADAEQALLAAFEAWFDATPAAGRVWGWARDLHESHLRALHAAHPPAAGASPSTFLEISDGTGGPAQQATATSVRALTAAATAATRGPAAAVLAAVAASHASLPDVSGHP